jgi:hypothetical protein
VAAADAASGGGTKGNWNAAARVASHKCFGIHRLQATDLELSFVKLLLRCHTLLTGAL